MGSLVALLWILLNQWVHQKRKGELVISWDVCNLNSDLQFYLTLPETLAFMSVIAFYATVRKFFALNTYLISSHNIDMSRSALSTIGFRKSWRFEDGTWRGWH